MNDPEQQEFTDLRRLLALKNYEQPEPSFFVDVLRQHRLERETRALSFWEKVARKMRRSFGAEGSWGALAGVSGAAAVCLALIWTQTPKGGSVDMAQVIGASELEGAPALLVDNGQPMVELFSAEPLAVVDFTGEKVGRPLGLAHSKFRREF